MARSFIDYSSFPLDVLQRALYCLCLLKSDGFPIDYDLIQEVSCAVIDRKTGFTNEPDIDNGDLADC